jgi:hypothetical protein
MNWDSLCLFIVPGGIAYIPLWFILIRPLNRRYKKALATLLGKEIARSLYQQMHPEFTYNNKYYPSDIVDEIVLNSAKETFNRLKDYNI